MVSISSLLNDIDEQTIVRRVAAAHDDARVAYSRRANLISNFDEFTSEIAAYYSYHFSRCISHGGTLSPSEAASMAKQALVGHFRQSGGDLMTAFAVAQGASRDGGMRAILDILADTLKSDSIERYLRSVLDHYINPSSWPDKVEAIRQFIAHVGPHNLMGIDVGQPERYASHYEVLIRSYVQSMQRASLVFRRY